MSILSMSNVDPISTAASLLKGLTSNLKSVGKTEVMSDLIELQAAILQIQNRQMELSAENHSLKEENKRLKETQDFKKNLNFNGRVYEMPVAGSQPDFYCPTCLDLGEKFVRISWLSDRNAWSCSACGNRWSPDISRRPPEIFTIG